MQLKIILSLIPLIAVAAAASSQSPFTTKAIVSDANTPQCPDYCAGTAYNSSLAQTYVCGDARLGPRILPTGILPGDLVHRYQPFGNLCPGQFLAIWYDSKSTPPKYRNPPNFGFQLATDNSSIQGNITLPVGFEIDRFGLEVGKYASPRGAPYIQRALPPDSLNTPQPNDSSPVYPFNYHVYKVTKPFQVLSGPTAGSYEQPGQGVQYKMSSNITTLVAKGFLSRVPLD